MVPTEEVEMEILMDEEPVEDEDEFSSGEEEEEEEMEETKRNEQITEITSPKIPVETKRESTGSLGFSKELSSILASKMSTLNDNEAENLPRGEEAMKEKEINTIKEAGKFQQRRKPPPPPAKPKVT